MKAGGLFNVLPAFIFDWLELFLFELFAFRKGIACFAAYFQIFVVERVERNRFDFPGIDFAVFVEHAFVYADVNYFASQYASVRVIVYQLAFQCNRQFFNKRGIDIR